MGMNNPYESPKTVTVTRRHIRLVPMMILLFLAVCGAYPAAVATAWTYEQFIMYYNTYYEGSIVFPGEEP